MKKILAALALAVVFATAAHAQSADSLAKARELMKVMNIEQTLTQHMSDADDIQRSGAFLITKIAEANPDEESKIGDLLVDEDRAILPQIIPGYVEYMAQAYAVNFTPAELDQLIGFYKSEPMQAALKKSAESTEVVEFDSDQQAQTAAFLQTPTGKKLQQRSPLIMKQVNVYAADVVRKKQRDMLYAALRQDLPKHDLKVPEPFAPDTFMDPIIHENTVKANTIPSAPPSPTTPQSDAPKQNIQLQGVVQPPARTTPPSFTQTHIQTSP